MFSFFKKKEQDPAERLHEILGDYELPRFRKSIFETLRRLRDPKATSADIAEVMSVDPDLTSRVMRTVNSPAYAPRTPIKDLSHAVTMLGKADLERIVMLLGAKMAVPKNVPKYVDMDAFWQRAGLRAVIARGLADLVAPAKAGLCFRRGSCRISAFRSLPQARAASTPKFMRHPPMAQSRCTSWSKSNTVGTMPNWARLSATSGNCQKISLLLSVHRMNPKVIYAPTRYFM